MEYPMAPTTETAAGMSGIVGFGFGLLCGAAIGAAIALLAAPKSGAEMRRDVGKSVDRMKRQASAKMSDVADRGRRAFQAGKDAFNEAAPPAFWDHPPSIGGGESFVR